MPPSIKPTKIERGNGWEELDLADYIAERNRAATLRIFGDPDAKKEVQVENAKRFDPHLWQRGR
jgi:hypothetical protein